MANNRKPGRPPKKPRDRHTVVYIVRFRPDTAATLKAEAERRKQAGEKTGATPSALIREFAQDALEALGK
jgi:hypothetical protein